MTIGSNKWNVAWFIFSVFFAIWNAVLMFSRVAYSSEWYFDFWLMVIQIVCAIYWTIQIRGGLKHG